MDRRFYRELFWDDIEMYRRRLKWIFEILDGIEMLSPDSCKITNSLFVRPIVRRFFKTEQELEDLYKATPEAFFVGERHYGVRSTDYTINLCNNNQIHVFSRDSILDYTL